MTLKQSDKSTHQKLFVVTVTYVVCSYSKERAEEEILRGHGMGYQSMKARELKKADGINVRVTDHAHRPISEEIEEEDIPF